MKAHPEYPRTYRSDPGFRTFSRFTAGLLMAVVVYALIGQAMGWIRRAPLQNVVFDVGFLVLMAAFIFIQSERTATIDADSITVKGLLGGSRTLRLGEIASRYHTPGGWRRVPTHVLIPADGSRKVKLPPSIHTDRALLDWLNQIPSQKYRGW